MLFAVLAQKLKSNILSVLAQKPTITAMDFCFVFFFSTAPFSSTLILLWQINTFLPLASAPEQERVFFFCDSPLLHWYYCCKLTVFGFSHLRTAIEEDAKLPSQPAAVFLTLATAGRCSCLVQGRKEATLGQKELYSTAHHKRVHFC